MLLLGCSIIISQGLNGGKGAGGGREEWRQTGQTYGGITTMSRLCVCVLARCLPYLRASLLGPVPHDVRFPRGVHDTSPRRRNLIDFPRNHHPFLFTCFGSDTLWIIGPNVYIYIYGEKRKMSRSVDGGVDKELDSYRVGTEFESSVASSKFFHGFSRVNFHQPSCEITFQARRRRRKKSFVRNSSLNEKK